MKNHRDHSKPSPQPAPTCWQREGSSPCVRVEPDGGEAHIFPYQQLITASLAHANGNDSLRLIFATSEVELSGRNLRDLFHALQDFAVKWVRPIPERYQALGNDAGVVTSIRITPVD